MSEYDKRLLDILAKDGTLWMKKIPVRAVQMKERFIANTHEGVLEGQPGDYLVQNVSGDSKPWPVRKDIFEQSYMRLKQ